MKNQMESYEQVETAIKHFAFRIDAARRRQRMPQAELAERVGVSLNTLKSVLRGRPGVAIGTAFKAASILGVPLFDEVPERIRLVASEKSFTVINEERGLRSGSA